MNVMINKGIIFKSFYCLFGTVPLSPTSLNTPPYFVWERVQLRLCHVCLRQTMANMAQTVLTGQFRLFPIKQKVYISGKTYKYPNNIVLYNNFVINVF